MNKFNYTTDIILDHGNILSTFMGSEQFNHIQCEGNQFISPSKTSFTSETSTILNENVTRKRPHSPIKIVLSFNKNNSQRTLLESVPKKKKTYTGNFSDAIQANVIKRKTNKKTPQERILSEYYDKKSKQVVQEQFKRDERIKLEQNRAELARIERVRKQQFYNGDLIDAFNQQQEIEFELVLERDPETNDIVIEVPLLLVINMKPHQTDGVKFLWNQVFESTARIANSIDPHTHIDNGGSGAILAHCMGLGKTFTTSTFLHTLFRYAKLTNIHRVLILCPLNTSINWKNEFHRWLDGIKPVINVYLFNNDDISSEKRDSFLRNWHENGGILLMGYQMYRQLTYNLDDIPEDFKRTPVEMKKRPLSSIEEANIETYRKYLRNPGPDLIVCDEGHMIKNRKSGIASTLNKIRTHRRIVLTGTPMQNNLKEYYAMVNFCKPNFLGTESEFSDRFRTPIEAGQHRDSSRRCVSIMRRRTFQLNQHLQDTLHRRGFDVLRAFLPPKFEYVIKIKCRPIQRKLYETYIQFHSIHATTTKKKLHMTTLFTDYQYLMKIWTHPWLLRSYFTEYCNKGLKDKHRFEMENIFEDDFTNVNGTMIETSSTQNILSSTSVNTLDEILEENLSDELNELWWLDLFDSNNSKFDFELSGKIVIVKAILDECESIGDKILLFSRSLMALDYIEQCLEHWSEHTPTSKWQKGVDYFRIDGKVPIKQRETDIALFNDTNNIRSRLFLISTVAGGLGVNLYSANRVIILDTSWNPANDSQAMFRSYRLGQTKPVYIYRLIIKGTMEEKIYKRQITKQAMFHRVVDAKQPARHFTYDELADLYYFDFDYDNDPMEQYDASRVQDRLLQHLMHKYADTIVSYCEHDSFLIHRDEENLTLEEQHEAKTEGEIELLQMRQESKDVDTLLKLTDGYI